jgi:hypothetical protein
MPTASSEERWTNFRVTVIDICTTSSAGTISDQSFTYDVKESTSGNDCVEVSGFTVDQLCSGTYSQSVPSASADVILASWNDTTKKHKFCFDQSVKGREGDI